MSIFSEGASPIFLLENWKPVVGYEGRYEVSNVGNVRAIDRRDRLGRLYRGRILCQQLDRSTGYLNVYPSKNGVQATFRVHSLVAESFLGPRLAGLVVNHKDGCKRNNRISNLEYVTFLENVRHAFSTGLNKSTLQYLHSLRKLSEADVRYIKGYSGDKTLTEIARELGVSLSTVWDVRNGKNWKHVT